MLIVFRKHKGTGRKSVKHFTPPVPSHLVLASSAAPLRRRRRRSRAAAAAPPGSRYQSSLTLFVSFSVTLWSLLPCPSLSFFSYCWKLFEISVSEPPKMVLLGSLVLGGGFCFIVSYIVRSLDIRVESTRFLHFLSNQREFLNSWIQVHIFFLFFYFFLFASLADFFFLSNGWNLKSEVNSDGLLRAFFNYEPSSKS